MKSLDQMTDEELLSLSDEELLTLYQDEIQPDYDDATDRYLEEQAAAERRTPLGHVTEGVTGVAAGAINTLGAGLSGLQSLKNEAQARLTGDDPRGLDESIAGTLGEALKGSIQVDPDYARTTANQVAQGVGSLATQVGMGALGRAAGASSLATVTPQVIGMGADTARENVLQFIRDNPEKAAEMEIDENYATLMSSKGILPGMAEVIGIEAILRKLPKVFAEIPGNKRRAAAYLARKGTEGFLAEGFSEGLAQALQNDVRQIYDEDAKIMDGVVHDGTVGGMVGALVALAVGGVQIKQRAKQEQDGLIRSDPFTTSPDSEAGASFDPTVEGGNNITLPEGQSIGSGENVSQGDSGAPSAWSKDDQDFLDTLEQTLGPIRTTTTDQFGGQQLSTSGQPQQPQTAPVQTEEIGDAILRGQQQAAAEGGDAIDASIRVRDAIVEGSGARRFRNLRERREAQQNVFTGQTDQGLQQPEAGISAINYDALIDNVIPTLTPLENIPTAQPVAVNMPELTQFLSTLDEDQLDQIAEEAQVPLGYTPDETIDAIAGSAELVVNAQEYGSARDLINALVNNPELQAKVKEWATAVDPEPSSQTWQRQSRDIVNWLTNTERGDLPMLTEEQAKEWQADPINQDVASWLGANADGDFSRDQVVENLKKAGVEEDYADLPLSVFPDDAREAVIALYKEQYGITGTEEGESDTEGESQPGDSPDQGGDTDTTDTETDETSEEESDAGDSEPEGGEDSGETGGSDEDTGEGEGASGTDAGDEPGTDSGEGEADTEDGGEGGGTGEGTGSSGEGSDSGGSDAGEGEEGGESGVDADGEDTEGAGDTGGDPGEATGGTDTDSEGESETDGGGSTGEGESGAGGGDGGVSGEPDSGDGGESGPPVIEGEGPQEGDVIGGEDQDIEDVPDDVAYEEGAKLKGVVGYSADHAPELVALERLTAGNVVYSREYKAKGQTMTIGVIETFDSQGNIYYSGYKTGTALTIHDIFNKPRSQLNLTKNQHEELLEAADMAVKANELAYMENPEGPFKDSDHVFTEGFPTDLQDVARDFIKLLDLQGEKLFFATPADLRDLETWQKHNLYGSDSGVRTKYSRFRGIGSLTDSLGATVPSGDGHVVMVDVNNPKLAKRKSMAIEVLAHEMGHVHHKVAFKNADQATKEAVTEEWRQHAIEAYENNWPLAEWFDIFQARGGQKSYPRISEGFKVRDLGQGEREYYLGFSEWFAEQTAQWAMSSAKPQSVVEKFFAKIGSALRRLYASVAGKKYLPQDEFKKYMDALAATKQIDPTFDFGPSRDLSLSDYLRQNQHMISDNRALKKAAAVWFKKKPSEVSANDMKQAQEAYELGLSKDARHIVRTLGTHLTDKAIFSLLAKRYRKQPRLNFSTATSQKNQAYSTPAPLAFIAGRLAGIDGKATYYEPTAGNGMLTITGSVDNGRVNEFDPARAENLKEAGFAPTQNDAYKFTPKGKFDAVIMNPPFGSMKESVEVDGYTISRRDHVVAANALKAMKDDGKAVLILGANRPKNKRPEYDRVFLNWLYNHFNVVDHFEADGKLYERQGAAWPVRVITIHGRKLDKENFPPAPDEIRRFDKWSDIYAYYDTQAKRFADGGSAVGTDGGSAGQPSGPDGLPSDAGEGLSAGEGDTGADGGSGSGQSDGGTTGTDGESGDGTAGGDGIGSGGFSGDGSGGSAADGTSGDIKGRKKKTGEDDGSDFQEEYVPRSDNGGEPALVPKNMEEALQRALDKIEAEVGNIDFYVMEKLGYTSRKQFLKAFMGLQVDTIAAAIYNHENLGKAIIIGDQTGVGKGRQAAAMIRYAKRQGMMPVFVSQKAKLFTDMYGDLQDIGEDVNPFIFNSSDASGGGYVVSKDSGKKLFAMTAPKKKAAIDNLMANGELPDGVDSVFTTYSQFNKPNKQRTALYQLAQNKKVFFVLDEAHTVSGELTKIVKQGNRKVEQPTTAGYFFNMLKDNPVTYLSATFAKRPDSMPIFFRTSIMDAVDNANELISAVQRGGAVLQTVLSNMLAQQGQFWRREKSFKGIQLPIVSDTDRKAEHQKKFNEVTSGLRQVMNASAFFEDVFLPDYAAQIAGQGAIAGIGGNQAQTTVDYSNFASVVHNQIRQVSLALKIDRTIDLAKQAVDAGQKPVIAMDLTMESFLKKAIADRGLKSGDVVDLDYRDVLLSALEGSRTLNITDAQGKKSKVTITKDQLDPATRDAYEQAEKLIKKLDIKDLPISPIDFIRGELEASNIKTAEVTGRGFTIDYSTSKPTLRVRTSADKDKNAAINGFNGGELDALILNQSGSTGLSIHSSKKFKDDKPRKMIVAQPLLDINDFMQMLGRINRTNQRHLPLYEIVNLDLPSEKRPMSVLQRKMRSLTANTSSNTDSDTTLDTPDILNKYGDEIVFDYLQENEDIAKMVRLSGLQEKMPNLAETFTGRLAVLPIEIQEEAYAEIEAAYKERIELEDKLGTNILKTKYKDLQARIIDSRIVYEGKAPNTIFGANATMHKVSAKMEGKPPTPDEVREAMEQAEGIERSTIMQNARDYFKKKRDDIDARLKKAGDNEKRREKATKDQAKLNAEAEQHNAWVHMTADLKPKSFHRLVIDDETVTAVVVGITHKPGKGGNPTALNKTKVKFMLNHGLRDIELPLSKLTPDGDYYDRPLYVKDYQIDSIFKKSGDLREERYIATGNLLSAASKLEGSVVNFTDDEGRTHVGILMPKKYKETQFKALGTNQDVPLRHREAMLRLMRDNKGGLDFSVYTNNQAVRVSYSGYRWVIRIPKANKDPAGRGIKFDDRLKEYLDEDFAGTGKEMKAHFQDAALETVMDILMDHAVFYADASYRGEYTSVGGPAEQEAATQFKLNNTGYGHLDVDYFVDEFKGKYQNAPQMKVVNNILELPEGALKKIRARGVEQSVAALFHNGRLYFLKNKFKSQKQLEETIFHEVLGHYGMRKLFGEGFEPLLEKVYSSMGNTALARDLKKAYFDNFDAKNKDHRLELAEELVASLAEKQGRRGLFMRVLMKVNQWLRDNGFNLKLNKYDLLRALDNAERILIDGQMVHTFDESTRFQVDMAEDLTHGHFKPVDALFSALPKAMGMMDEHGRMKVGVKAEQWLKRLLTENEFDEGGRFEFMNSYLKTARAGLVDRYGLSDEYKALWAKTEARIRKGRNLIRFHLDKMRGMTPEELKMLNEVLTGDIAQEDATDEINRLAAPIRALIDQMGMDLVDAGMISQEAYEKHQGAYLHRSYMKYIEQEFGGLPGWIANQVHKNRKKVLGSEAIRRGWTLEAKPNDLGAKGLKNLRDLMGEEYTLLEDANGRRKWVKGEDMTEDGWTSKGTFEVVSVKRGKVELNRDWTKAEREEMGEIVDARFNITKTFYQSTNDVAMGKFFQSIAENPDWFTKEDPEETGEGTVLRGRDKFSVHALTSHDYVQVPTAKAADGKSPLSKYGALAGGYVRAEIWRDLQELDKMKNPGTWGKIMRQWKSNKTVRNPVVHMNNVMSNVILMDMADVGFKDLYNAFYSMKNQDEHYRNAEENGAFGGAYIDHEIRDQLAEIFDEIKRDYQDPEEGPVARINSVSKILYAITEAARKLDKGAEWAYEMEDTIFRMATYQARIDKNDTPAEAAKIAREQFLDYDIRAPWINNARRYVIPFLSYTYRAIPVITTAMMHRPWKMVKYVALAEIANSMAYALAPGDEDEERGTLPDYEAGRTWLQIPGVGGLEKMVRLGTDESGNPIFLNVSRWIPMGDIFETNSSAIGIPTWMQLGGPIMMAGEFLLNKQALTGKDITNEADTLGEKLGKNGAWFYQSWMPSIVPGGYAGNKLYAAATGQTDARGEDLSMLNAMGSSLGVKYKTHDVALGRRYRSYAYRQSKRYIKYQIKTARREHQRGAMSDADLKRKVEFYREKLLDLRTNYREKLGY